MAAAQYDPWALPIFDLSREFILTYPTPPIQVANELANSTTRSTYRLHWNWIALWDDFGTLVHQYWNHVVPFADKQSNIFTQAEYTAIVHDVSTFSRVANEGEVKGKIRDFVVPVHSSAANGRNSAPRPSDQHSILKQWEPGIEANNLAGIPDFVMTTEYGIPLHRITAILEVKNPWQITPALIDNVINSTVRYSLSLTL